MALLIVILASTLLIILGGALIWLMAVWFKARQGSYTKRNEAGLQTCSMYWIFVVALWPILYGLVYLY